mmetsp:Transcript_6068/g.8832  ORF Transcript_6068/g.8832 Transcript_6068/m.8832 type:complete len:123 (+) Transcript_6068:93-461(+)
MEIETWTPQLFQYPLHLACVLKKMDDISFFIKHTTHINVKSPHSGMTPLMIACSIQNDEMVKLLLQHHANVYERDVDGLSSILMVIQNQDIEIAKLLLHHDSRLAYDVFQYQSLLHLLLEVS